MMMTNLKAICLGLFLMTNILAHGKKNGTESGPFRSLLVNVSLCDTASYPIIKDPSVRFFAEAYPGPTYPLLRGNLSVVRETRRVKIKMKSFVWVGGKWKLTYLMNGISCHGMLLHLICKAINLQQMFDRQKCLLHKGYFSFSNLDIDKMQHIWTSKMEYGRTLWRSEIIVGTASYSCWDFQTLVERA